MPATDLKAQKGISQGLYVVMDGELAPMKEVIAVFAVRANAEGDELMTMDEAKKDQFLLVFWGMNTIRAYTEEKIKIEIVYETDADGNTVEVQREKIEVYLHIETTHLTAEQGADAYSFTDKQKGTIFIPPIITGSIYYIIEIVRLQSCNHKNAYK